MDIMQLVDELEAIISRSPRFPFTANVWVNEDEIFDILDQMRIAIPKEVKEARRTEAERERILAQAQDEANRLVSMGKEKIMSAVDEHEVMITAREESRKVLSQAQKEAFQMQEDANNYVVEHLSSLEEQLLKLLTTVRNGLRQVETMKPAAPPPTENTPQDDA